MDYNIPLIKLDPPFWTTLPPDNTKCCPTTHKYKGLKCTFLFDFSPKGSPTMWLVDLCDCLDTVVAISRSTPSTKLRGNRGDRSPPSNSLTQCNTNWTIFTSNDHYSKGPPTMHCLSGSFIFTSIHLTQLNSFIHKFNSVEWRHSRKWGVWLFEWYQ